MGFVHRRLSRADGCYIFISIQKHLQKQKRKYIYLIIFHINFHIMHIIHIFIKAKQIIVIR